MLVQLFIGIALLATVSIGTPYHVPSHLLAEVIKTERAYSEDQNSDKAKFELAMAYGYTGNILEGWKLLKTIDKGYAEVVVKNYYKKQIDDPNNWKHSFKLAFGYYFIGDKTLALEAFNHVLELNPKQVWTMGFIALIEGEEGDTDSALEWCRRALKIEPNATAIHLLAAEGYRRKNDYLSAISHVLTFGRLSAQEGVRLPK